LSLRSWRQRTIEQRKVPAADRYGGFTVSESQVDPARAYIRNQEEHHRTVSFEEEYKELLRLHGISFDERYLWG
jgi:hypothetical protein